MPITHALIGDQAFYLYTPRSATERHTGLSAFSSIAPNEGMIFYGLPDDHLAIWMKDMSFAIDVIWLDHHDRIVHSEQHVTPDSYPTMYQNPPSRPASYLIELPSGTVERLSLDRGDTVTFPDR